MSGSLLDTSVVIAIGNGSLAPLEGQRIAISAVTLCGLHHGVLAASDELRPGRLALLGWAERTFEPAPLDASVAPVYARLARAAAAAGRDVRRNTADLLIAATAAANDLTLLTRDEKLARLPGLDVELV